MGVVIKVFRYPSEYRYKVAQVVAHYYQHEMKIMHYARHTVVIVYPTLGQRLDVVDRRDKGKVVPLNR